MKRTHAAAAVLAALLVAGSGYVAGAPSAVAQPAAASALQHRLDRTELRVAAARQALKAHEKALGVRKAQARAAAMDLERAQAGTLASGERTSVSMADAVTRARTAWQAAQQGAEDLAALVKADRVRLAAANSDLTVLRRAAAADRVRRPTSAGDGLANPLALRAVDFALAQVGDPYVWAANGPDSWDCSGLTRGAYLSVGVSLPRVSRQQFWAGPLVGRGDLLPGDLLFFAYNPADPSSIHHVAMYIGSGLMVHAPQTGDVVRIAPVWSEEYAGAVRVLPAVSGGTGHGTPGAGASGSPAPGLTPPGLTPPAPAPSPSPSNGPRPALSPTPSPDAVSPSESPPASLPENLLDGLVSPLGVPPLFSATP